MQKTVHVALTFDVEQWDQSSREQSYRDFIALLGSTPTTWFVAEDRTQSFAERYPGVARELMSRGHELAAHVHFQRAELNEMIADVRTATRKLRAVGSPCISFRGGAHVFCDRLADEIFELGYKYDSSAVPGLMRRYETHAGHTMAAYPHVLSARPFWWRPGLLELPTASFPITRPKAFLKKRFRLPLLIDEPMLFRARISELADDYPGSDVPIVVLGHSSDVEGQLDRLASSIDFLRADPSIRMTTLADLGAGIASGALSAAIRGTPPELVRGALRVLTRILSRS